MTDSVRGGIIVSVILFAAVLYYFIWVYEPGGAGPQDDSGGNGAVAAGYLDRTPEIPDPSAMEVNKPAPDFAYVTIQGREIRLSDYVGDKPVVLDFWATWCRPCLEELPILQEFYDEHSDVVEIIAISTEARPAASAIARVVTEKSLTFPIIHDPSGGISQLYPTRVLPYLVFVNRDGMVVNIITGARADIGDVIIGTFGL